MNHKKKPIQRILVFGAAVFISFTCLILSIQSYLTFSKSLYTRYDEHLATVIQFLENQIDKDDLYNNVQTKERSAKYEELQQLQNKMVDDFNLFYLYIIYPADSFMYNICSGTSAEERARGEEDLPLMKPDSGYTPEVLKQYQQVMNGNEIVYFEEDSDWGAAYTACKPLRNSNDKAFGLMCADISIELLHKTVNSYVTINVVLTLALGLLFGILLIIWLHRNVTGPIQLLEKSAHDFAKKCHGKKDPNAITFEQPEIHTENEVESLSHAINQMASDMREYIQTSISAEEDAKNAQEKAAGMTMLAYRDALTHVGSKIAYDEMRKSINHELRAGKTDVAIIMVDLNNLKNINDSYGHDRGDSYILGSCQIICKIFKHSAIFRFGGDEFIVLLKGGGDFENRQALLEEARLAFRKAQKAEDKEPWKRYSAAVGLAEYTEDDTIDSIFKRADADMYQNKMKIKGISN